VNAPALDDATVDTGGREIPEGPNPSRVNEYRPVGDVYDTTYSVAADTGTGEENTPVCHPDADSPDTVACANRTPPAVHNDTVCVPVFPGSL
jgi:hypothetical protein